MSQPRRGRHSASTAAAGSDAADDGSAEPVSTAGSGGWESSGDGSGHAELPRDVEMGHAGHVFLPDGSAAPKPGGAQEGRPERPSRAAPRPVGRVAARSTQDAETTGDLSARFVPAPEPLPAPPDVVTAPPRAVVTPPHQPAALPPFPAAVPPPRPAPVAAPSGNRHAVRPGHRRARLTLSRIDPWSALKVSFVLAVCLFVVWMVAVVVLYSILDRAGTFASVNQTLSDVLGTHIPFNAPGILGGAAVLGAFNVVIVTALGTVAAFAYNVTSALVGGLDVTLAERD